MYNFTFHAFSWVNSVTCFVVHPFQALIGAKQVHSFVRDADDCIDWIQEKEVVVSSDNYGTDRESTQALIDKHDGFEVRMLSRTG